MCGFEHTTPVQVNTLTTRLSRSQYSQYFMTKCDIVEFSDDTNHY